MRRARERDLAADEHLARVGADAVDRRATFVTPLICTEPLVGAWWQSSETATTAVMRAVTSKLAEPRHVVVPSVAVALSVMW